MSKLRIRNGYLVSRSGLLVPSCNECPPCVRPCLPECVRVIGFNARFSSVRRNPPAATINVPFADFPGTPPVVFNQTYSDEIYNSGGIIVNVEFTFSGNDLVWCPGDFPPASYPFTLDVKWTFSGLTGTGPTEARISRSSNFGGTVVDVFDPPSISGSYSAITTGQSRTITGNATKFPEDNILGYVDLEFLANLRHFENLTIIGGDGNPLPHLEIALNVRARVQSCETAIDP